MIPFTVELRVHSLIELLILIKLLPARGLEFSLADFHFCFDDIMIVDCSKVLDKAAEMLLPVHENGFSAIDFETFVSIPDSDIHLPHCIFILYNLSQCGKNPDVNNKISSMLSGIRRGTKPIVFNIVVISSNFSIEEDWDQHFSDIHLPVDSDFYSLLLSPGNLVYSIRETYSIRSTRFHNEVIMFEDISEFPDADLWYTLTSKVARRKNFQKAVIVAIVRNGTSQQDWMNFRIGSNNEIILLGGFSVFLIKDFQMLLNFTIEAVVGDLVTILPNNTLIGSTAELLKNGSADISLSQSLIIPSRAKFLSFMQPSYSSKIYIYFKQPPPSSITNVTYAPFSLPVWITLCSLWISMFLIIKLKNILVKRMSYNFESLSGDRKFASDAEMWIFVAISLKSWHTVPDSWSLKLVLLMGSFLSLIVYAAYSGQIVSALSVNSVPINSFMQLVGQKFTFTVHMKSDPFKTFLQLLIEEFHLRQNLRTIKTEDEITHLLNPSRPQAFFTYPDLFYNVALALNYSERYVCDTIYWIPYSDIPTVNGLFLRKGSDLTETFNHKLLILKEFGLNYRYAKNYDIKNFLSCTTSVAAQKFDPVTYEDIISIFYFIYVGVAFSLLLLLLEVFSFKIQLKSRPLNLN